MIVVEAAGLTVSEKKTETMLQRTPDQAPRTAPLVIEAAGRTSRKATQLLYLGGLVNANTDIMPEVDGFDSHGHATNGFSGSRICLLYTSPSPRD